MATTRFWSVGGREQAAQLRGQRQPVYAGDLLDDVDYFLLGGIEDSDLTGSQMRDV